jgi:hypothetical protein
VDRRAGTPRVVNEDKKMPNLCGVSPKPGADVSPGGYVRSRYELRRTDNSRRELDELMPPAYRRYVEERASSRHVDLSPVETAPL